MDELNYTKIKVFGFHGCDEDIKSRLLSKEIDFNKSINSYDWLGDGIYFWENDFSRAKKWSKLRDPTKPASAIGAEINLGICLDLSNSYAREMLKLAYEDFVFQCKVSEIKIPENKNPIRYTGNPNDLVLRYLDRAVIQHLFTLVKINEPDIAYDTVRSPFQEGFPLYPGSSFKEHDHIQICVRNIDCIQNLFDPDAK